MCNCYGQGLPCMARVPCAVYNCTTQSQNHKGQSGGKVYWKPISNPLSQEFESLRVRGLKTCSIRGQQTVGMSSVVSVQLKLAVEFIR